MTWSELIQHASQFSPNAEVWVSIHPPHMLCRMNFAVGGVRGDGEMVFLDGVNEQIEGGGTC